MLYPQFGAEMSMGFVLFKLLISGRTVVAQLREVIHFSTALVLGVRRWGQTLLSANCSRLAS